MTYNRKDHYWLKAKREGYRSRAAYKLAELQRKYRVFRKGDTVVDLGCAPGGWLQVIAEEVGPSGSVIGLDRLSVRPLPQAWVTVLQGDIQDIDFQRLWRERLGRQVNAMTSDMSPDLSGVGFQDHHRSCDLVRCALVLAREILVPGGNLLSKVFEGEELNGLVRELRIDFREVKRVVPGASRKSSSEVYLMAKGFSCDSRR